MTAAVLFFMWSIKAESFPLTQWKSTVKKNLGLSALLAYWLLYTLYQRKVDTINTCIQVRGWRIKWDFLNMLVTSKPTSKRQLSMKKHIYPASKKNISLNYEKIGKSKKNPTKPKPKTQHPIFTVYILLLNENLKTEPVLSPVLSFL